MVRVERAVRGGVRGPSSLVANRWLDDAARPRWPSIATIRAAPTNDVVTAPVAAFARAPFPVATFTGSVAGRGHTDVTGGRAPRYLAQFAREDSHGVS